MKEDAVIDRDAAAARLIFFCEELRGRHCTGSAGSWDFGADFLILGISRFYSSVLVSSRFYIRRGFVYFDYIRQEGFYLSFPTILDKKVLIYHFRLY